MAIDRDTPRDVRLAAGGRVPPSWQEMSTAALRLRWASAVSYAQRTTAVPPSPAAAEAVTALAVELDRRGALLPPLPSGDRAARLAAAGQRLHVIGTIVRAVGLPPELRSAGREEAEATVTSIWDERLSAEELHAAGADRWTPGELQQLIDAARRARSAPVAAGAPVEQPWSPPESVSGPAAGVVDISLPHPTEGRSDRSATPPVYRPGSAAG